MKITKNLANFLSEDLAWPMMGREIIIASLNDQLSAEEQDYLKKCIDKNKMYNNLIDLINELEDRETTENTEAED